MRVLFDIGHPAHVHQFKNTIKRLRESGHEIMITARMRDISFQLLDFYEIEYKQVGRLKKGLVNKLFGLVETDIELLSIAKKFNPDILVGGSGNMYVSHVSWLLGKVSFIFEDTEHAQEQILMYLPFTDFIVTPSSYLDDYGPKHIRYNGFHELAYLHPDIFSPDQSVLTKVGLKPNEPYALLRFISWDASHDLGIKRFSNQEKREIINVVEKYARPVISIESSVPDEFKKYQIEMPPHYIHDLMYYSKMYIGEGATMALECVCLGVPVIYINPLSAGILKEVQNYNLLEQTTDLQVLKNIIDKYLNNPMVNSEQKEHSTNFLKDKINVTDFYVGLIENYPKSIKDYKAKIHGGSI